MLSSTKFPLIHSPILLCFDWRTIPAATYRQNRRPGSPPGRRFLFIGYITGISSILPDSGSPLNPLAWQIALTVVPQIFAKSQSLSPSVRRRIKDGRFGSGRFSSPTSKAQIIICPRSVAALISRNRFPFAVALPPLTDAVGKPSVPAVRERTVSPEASRFKFRSQRRVADCKVPFSSSYSNCQIPDSSPLTDSPIRFILG